MPETDDQISCCGACGATMDVSALEPFTNVECPACKHQMRVKREFGPYLLTRRHAIGGMSLVFVAEDATLNREAIVKILNKEYSVNEARIAAFEEEARITASFSHPNVVRVFTTGRAFDRFFIAMELVPGGHLEHHIRERGWIPEAEALDLAIDVAEGLNAAMRAGLIHRDVKPGNILLDSKGRATLVDFGLALVTKDGFATPSEIWATPYYVPPETIEGGQEDFRSDIYAFGATFYHALSGNPPCDEESMNTRRLREAKRQVGSLAKVSPHLSPVTCAAVDRCMAYRPEDRFRSYHDLLAALKTARAEALSSGPAQVEPRNQRIVRRSASRWQRSAIVGAALLVLVAVAFTATQFESEPESRELGPAAKTGSAPRPSSGEILPGPPEAPLSDDRPTDGREVGPIYREAKEALIGRHYTEAESLFAQVRDHPGVLEPTGSWAACEAIAAAFFDGRPEEARAQAETSLARMNAKLAAGESIPDQIPQTLRALGEWQPIPEPASFDDPDAHPLLWLLAGLKHWSQGLLDRAEPFFLAVSRIGATDADSWLAPYANMAVLYLADLEHLRAAEPSRFDLPPADCRALIDELHAVHSLLETRGRARFHVRCWQLELEKQARRTPPRAPDEPDAARDSGNERPEKLAELYREARFEPAIDLLHAWTPTDPDVRAERDAYLELTRAAAMFLVEMLERVPDDGLAVVLRDRDGQRFTRVIGSDEKGLKLVADSGEKITLPCRRIEPDSLISLHRQLATEQTSTLDTLRRHEQAVAFDFLAGNSPRAREAGNRLADSHEPFRKRWEKFSAVVEP